MKVEQMSHVENSISLSVTDRVVRLEESVDALVEQVATLQKSRLETTSKKATKPLESTD